MKDNENNFMLIDMSLYENGNINLFDKTILNENVLFIFTFYLLDLDSRDFIILEIPVYNETLEISNIMTKFDDYKNAEPEDIMWLFKIKKNIQDNIEIETNGDIGRYNSNSSTYGAVGHNITLIHKFQYFNEDYRDTLTLNIQFTIDSNISDGNSGDEKYR